jgi:hypothetical protein
LEPCSSYDNFYGTTPHRLVEFEFASLEDAMKYWQHEEIQKIGQDIPNRSNQASLNLFIQRGDYLK